jgi:RNA polymerase sigma-70 factor (ECF subfamily)
MGEQRDVPWPRSQPKPATAAPDRRGAAELRPSDADDDALVAAARADRQAFHALYERYANQVYRFCYLKLGSREAAEDVVSETFLKAMASLGSYRGGVFAGWLFRIAANSVTDAQRRRRPTAALDAADEVTDPAREPEDTVVARSEVHALRLALQRLPDDQRAMLELQLADLSTEEIADALGRSPNAVRHLRSRAQANLRVLLNDGMQAQRGGSHAQA